MSSFTCFEHFGVVIEQIPQELRGELATAIILYGTMGIEPELRWELRASFEALRNDIDNSVNAKERNKGGRPKKNKENQCSENEETKVSETENQCFETQETQVSEIENPCFESSKPKLNQANINQANIDKDKGVPAKPRATFKPPSLDEVKSFWESENLRGSPDEFYDHYSACGWVIGKNKPMKNWNASARNWSRREIAWGSGGDTSDYVTSAVGELAF